MKTRFIAISNKVAGCHEKGEIIRGQKFESENDLSAYFDKNDFKITMSANTFVRLLNEQSTLLDNCVFSFFEVKTI